MKKTICGRELPLMKVIEGRSDAFVILPSGNMLSPMFFYAIFKPIKGIKHWRVIQADLRHINILVVPSEDFSSDTIDNLKRRVEEHIRENIEINVEIVEKIPPDPSGKVRAVISKVKSQI